MPGTWLLAVATNWPDSIDLAATAAFVALVVAIPLAGYVLIALDFRRYLRSLRRALVVAAQPFLGLPEWARRQTPACLVVFGLRLPCEEEDLKRAYRQKVKRLHPDRGGDQQRFLEFQRHFEQGLRFIAEERLRRGGPMREAAGGAASATSGGAARQPAADRAAAAPLRRGHD